MNLSRLLKLDYEKNKNDFVFNLDSSGNLIKFTKKIFEIDNEIREKNKIQRNFSDIKFNTIKDIDDPNNYDYNSNTKSRNVRKSNTQNLLSHTRIKHLEILRNKFFEINNNLIKSSKIFNRNLKNNKIENHDYSKSSIESSIVYIDTINIENEYELEINNGKYKKNLKLRNFVYSLNLKRNNSNDSKRVYKSE
jgi:hypothetical protein